MLTFTCENDILIKSLTGDKEKFSSLRLFQNCTLKTKQIIRQQIIVEALL